LGSAALRRRYGAPPLNGDVRRHMNALRTFSILTLWALSSSVLSMDAGFGSPIMEDTEAVACQILKSAVVRQHHLPADTPLKWKWYCEFSTSSNDLVRVVALRAGRCDAYSCLMGWFAVMRRSSLVLQYDVGENRIVEMDRYPPENK
jgi:hypothetical protein